MCRKAHGAPFATYLTTPASHFHFVSGETARTRYRSSSVGLTRAFCPRCGSVVPNVDTHLGLVYIPAGCLDDDPGVRPSAHIFVRSKAPWFPITDDLPRYDAYPAESGLPEVEPPPLPAPAEGALRGSCLCGKVVFHVTEPFKVVHHCHCSRCRKARAAAHTTNGFTSANGIRFIKGEDHIDTYKVPDAKYFTHVFCRTCGSGMPRVNRERGIAAIPLGALDDDPGRGADDHIFVAYKASWYEITDDIVRYDEGPPA
jgi:hypothetical protein